MKNKILQVRTLPIDLEIILLLLRVIAGIAMAMHGVGKIQSPFNWMGPDASVPAFLQFLAAVAEFGGGIALALGVVTRIASLGITITMLVAFSLHAFILGDPFVNPKGSSYELATLYLIISLFFIFYGGGRFSIDGKLFR
jgi:putative oxidoreductase